MRSVQTANTPSHEFKLSNVRRMLRGASKREVRKLHRGDAYKAWNAGRRVRVTLFKRCYFRNMIYCIVGAPGPHDLFEEVCFGTYSPLRALLTLQLLAGCSGCQAVWTVPEKPQMHCYHPHLPMVMCRMISMHAEPAMQGKHHSTAQSVIRVGTMLLGVKICIFVILEHRIIQAIEC